MALPTTEATGPSIDALRTALEQIRADMLAEVDANIDQLDLVHPSQRLSAINLLHYLAFRRRDLRSLQYRLAALGLSSLGRAEAHVMATIDAVLNLLNRLDGRPGQRLAGAGQIDFESGGRLLAEHADSLLGRSNATRPVRIMVTVPGEAADDENLIAELLERGMDCIRINCAHDDPSTWRRMIRRLRSAEARTGRRCRVVMDLGGPKLRTGPIAAGPTVARVRPRRDDFGRVTEPARIRVTTAANPEQPIAGATLHLNVHGSWWRALEPGEHVLCRDARDRPRRFLVTAVDADGCWLETTRTAYLTPTTRLCAEHRAGHPDAETPVGPLPVKPERIRLQQNDLLVLSLDQQPGQPARLDAEGAVCEPARIGVTLPEAFLHVQAGDAIWFDDGKIGGRVAEIRDTELLVRVTHVRPQGRNLGSDKGINLPDSRLDLPALTPKDLRDLSVVLELADVVELSFANSAADVAMLQQLLSRHGIDHPAIVLKIETRRGFENLPEMLLTAMRAPYCGVMIARGDLAVECGFERLAEIQEEILWICEAAHIPVIWATQVLESLARDGMPSRAEVTDAAMGHRAECVMLNKGPHIAEAVTVLDSILRRMEAHQTKKRAKLRKLNLASSGRFSGARAIGAAN